VIDALAVAAERLGTDAKGVLARLGGPLGHAVRTAHGELARQDAGTRKRRRVEILARVRAAVPASVRAVHPSWIEHALEELPARAREALASGATTSVDVWLARYATAALPPTLDRDRDVLAWLGSIGADQFALALGEQARQIPALAAAAVRITQQPRVGQLGPTRAALARCRGVSLDDELALIRVGSRALAPHLAADLLARLRLVLLVPRPIGVVVARELRAHAATSFDQCPSWAALDAQ
jgi:hypothetical protein